MGNSQSEPKKKSKKQKVPAQTQAAPVVQQQIAIDPLTGQQVLVEQVAMPVAQQKIGKRGLPVVKKADFELGKPFNRGPTKRALGGLGGGQVHVLICALDYIGSASPLTCSIDGKNMQALAAASGIQDVTAMYNTQCTKEGMIAALKQTAAKCKPGDTFFFFFAGHGMSSTDYDGDEEDGKDENYVCDFTNQRMDPNKHYLSDDEFVAILTSSLSKEVNVIVVSDCCHSGSVCDFKKQVWKGYNAVSISGCRDTQTSGDTGKGGICTHSMMLATEQLLKEGKTSWSVGQLARKTIYFDDTMMASSQDIQFDKAQDTRPDSVPWPLVPKGPFTAPYNTPSGLLPGADSLTSTGGAAPTMGMVAAPAGYPAAVAAAPAFSYAAPTAVAAAPAFSYAAPTAAAVAAPAVTYAAAPTAAVAAPAVTYAAAPTAVAAAPTMSYAAPTAAAIAAPTTTFAAAPTAAAAAAVPGFSYGVPAAAATTYAAPTVATGGYPLPAVAAKPAAVTTAGTTTASTGFMGSMASAKPATVMSAAAPSTMARPATVSTASSGFAGSMASAKPARVL